MATNKLWDAAYRLHERELRWLDRLPELLAARSDWPVDRTVAFDVGASVGVYSRSLARWCTRVHAIAPNATLVPGLQDMPDHVLVHNAAAGSAAGHGHLTDTSADGLRRPLARLGDPSQAAWSQACDIIRLDTLEPNAPAAWIAKIDTEGTEADVIEGLGARLDDPFAMVLVEIEALHNPDFREVFNRMEQNGFVPCRVAFGRLRPAQADDVLRHARGPGGRLSALWPWSNNYIFLRSNVATHLGAARR